MPAEELQLATYLRREHVLCGMDAATRDEALRRLVTLVHEQEDGFDLEGAVAAAIDREKVAPTVIAPGLALPHARLADIDRLCVAVGTSPGGIVFDRAEPPVHLVILVLTPRSEPSAYLRVVAAVSKTLGDAEVRGRLLACRHGDQLFEMLSGRETVLPGYLRARNVMNPAPVALKEGDTLAAAIDAFCRNRVADLPVVDEEGDLRGVVSVEDLLRLSLPEHLLWMEDLSPILDFQPFAELLRRDQETRVADFMREEYRSIAPETPAIQLARMFAVHGVRQIYVLDGRRLLGAVNLQSFIAQIFWG